MRAMKPAPARSCIRTVHERVTRSGVKPLEGIKSRLRCYSRHRLGSLARKARGNKATSPSIQVKRSRNIQIKHTGSHAGGGPVGKHHRGELGKGRAQRTSRERATQADQGPSASPGELVNRTPKCETGEKHRGSGDLRDVQNYQFTFHFGRPHSCLTIKSASGMHNAMCLSGKHVLVAYPETQRLEKYDASRGTRCWSRPLPEGLYDNCQKWMLGDSIILWSYMLPPKPVPTMRTYLLDSEQGELLATHHAWGEPVGLFSGGVVYAERDSQNLVVRATEDHSQVVRTLHLPYTRPALGRWLCEEPRTGRIAMAFGREKKLLIYSASLEDGLQIEKHLHFTCPAARTLSVHPLEKGHLAVSSPTEVHVYTWDGEEIVRLGANTDFGLKDTDYSIEGVAGAGEDGVMRVMVRPNGFTAQGKITVFSYSI